LSYLYIIRIENLPEVVQGSLERREKEPRIKDRKGKAYKPNLEKTIVRVDETIEVCEPLPHTHICSNLFRNMVDGSLGELVVQHSGSREFTSVGTWDIPMVE